MMPLAQLNLLDRPGFVTLCGPFFENSAWIADAAWSDRPFASRANLHAAMCKVVTDSSADAQLALICAHPDLVGKLAREGRLTAHSTGEQAAAGLTHLSHAEALEFDRRNAEYRGRFGFPFVICARENKKEAILAAFPARLQNNRDEEINTALQEIYKIAWWRLIDAVSES